MGTKKLGSPTTSKGKPNPLADAFALRAAGEEAKLASWARLDALGVDWYCDQLLAGKSLKQIAKETKCRVADVTDWPYATTERSARITEARTKAANSWNEEAERVITEARGPFQLAKARELAHHYRWRAKCVAPSQFGDKIDVTTKNTHAIQLTDAQRKALDDALDQNY